ncbi:MAG: urease accessory protein UreF [Pseudomonadota bacterium]
MTDTTALLSLMSWLSPVFPTGGFAYSAGLEQAVSDEMVANSADLETWITAQIERGSLWNDAVFFAQAHRDANNLETLRALSAHAVAMTNPAERLDETTTQGTSFLEAASHWIEPSSLARKNTPLPICVGAAAGLQSIDLVSALSAYLHAFTTNQLQAAIRLSVIGQNSAAAVLAKLEPVINETAKRAAVSTLDDLGTSTFLADIAAMKHETLQPRLFKS